MFLVTAVTTLTHLGALAVSPSWFYSAIIASNTVASFVWHLGSEKSILFGVIDHGIAIVWFLTDLWYGYSLGLLTEVIIMNSFIAFLDALTIFDRKSYVLWHSLWHLLSALKAYFLALLFSSSQV